MSRTFLETLAHEVPLSSSQGEIEVRGVTITWSEGREIAVDFEATSAVRFTPSDPGRIQISRTHTEEKSLWSWVRGTTRPAVHVELRNAQGTVRLRARVGDSDALKGLPEVRGRGVLVPLDGLEELLRCAQLMGANLAQLPASVPPPKARPPRPGLLARWWSEPRSRALLIMSAGVVMVLTIIVMSMLMTSSPAEVEAKKEIAHLKESTTTSPTPICERPVTELERRALFPALITHDPPVWVLGMWLYDPESQATCLRHDVIDVKQGGLSRTITMEGRPATRDFQDLIGRGFAVRSFFDNAVRRQSHALLGAGGAHGLWFMTPEGFELRSALTGKVWLEHEEILKTSPELGAVLWKDTLIKHTMKVDAATGALDILGTDARWYRVSPSGELEVLADEVEREEKGKALERRCKHGAPLNEGHRFSRLQAPSGHHVWFQGEPRRHLRIAEPTVRRRRDYDRDSVDTFLEPLLVVAHDTCRPVETGDSPSVIVLYRTSLNTPHNTFASVDLATGQTDWTLRLADLPEIPSKYDYNKNALLKFDVHVVGNTLLVWTSEPYVRAFDAVTGKPLWQWGWR